MLTFVPDYLVRCVKSSSRDWIVRFERYTHVIATWNDTKPRQITTVAISNIIFGLQIRPNVWPVTLVWQLDYIIRCTSLTRLKIKVVEGDVYPDVERSVYHPAMKGRKRQRELVLSMTTKSIGYRKNDCSNRPSSIYQNSEIGSWGLKKKNCKILTTLSFCKSRKRLWENQTKYRNMTENLGVMSEF